MLKRSAIGPMAIVFVALQALMFTALAIGVDPTAALAQQQGGGQGGNQGGNQGGGLNVDVDISDDNDPAVWYGQWWVWAAGVAVFLIIVIALTNRGGRAA